MATSLPVALAAVLLWTCAGAPPHTRTDRPAPDPAADAPDDPSTPRIAAAPPAASAEPPFEPIADEGVPGYRIPIHDPSGEALAHFHDALRRAEAGEGQARLAFYGASHVASDLFTGHIRDALQRRFGDAGPGFVIPAHPWRFYRHQRLEIESSRRLWSGHKVRATTPDSDYYGLAGAYVETSRRGAFGVITPRERDGLGGKVARFDLYYMEQPGGGTFEVKIDGEVARRIDTGSENKGAGYATFEVEDGSHRFEVRTVDDRPVRIFGVAVERETPGVILDTLGINGARARYHLQWEDGMYREHLARRSPDLVVLAYGTNESGDEEVPISTYEERLRRVLTRIQEVVPEASCLLVGPSDRPFREAGDVLDRPRTGQLVDAQRRVSEEMGCGFFDLVAFMGGPLSMVDWVEHEPRYGAPDHIHYTRRGYARLGEALHFALLHGYEPAAE